VSLISSTGLLLRFRESGLVGRVEVGAAAGTCVVQERSVTKGDATDMGSADIIARQKGGVC
jgi:hypothetical protein